MDVHRSSCGLLWRLVGHSAGKCYRRLQDSQDQGSPLAGKNILTGSWLGWPKCQSRNLWDLSSHSRSSDLWLCGTFIDDAFMMHGFIAYCWDLLGYPYHMICGFPLSREEEYCSRHWWSWSLVQSQEYMKPPTKHSCSEAHGFDGGRDQGHFPTALPMSPGKSWKGIAGEKSKLLWLLGATEPTDFPQSGTCTHTIFVYHICALLCQHAYLAAVPSRMTRTTRFSPFWCRVLWLWHFCTATDGIVACLWAPPSLVFYHLTKGRTRLRSPQPEKKPPYFHVKQKHHIYQNIKVYSRICPELQRAAFGGGGSSGHSAHQAGRQGGRLGHLAAWCWSNGRCMWSARAGAMDLWFVFISSTTAEALGSSA